MDMNDYETASYFYNKCLDISTEDGHLKGESEAYLGLGKCEEKVLNIFHAKGNMEEAHKKAVEANLVEKSVLVHSISTFDPLGHTPQT